MALTKVLEIKVAVVASPPNAAPEARTFASTTDYIARRVAETIKNEIGSEERYSVVFGWKMYDAENALGEH